MGWRRLAVIVQQEPIRCRLAGTRLHVVSVCVKWCVFVTPISIFEYVIFACCDGQGAGYTLQHSLDPKKPLYDTEWHRSDPLAHSHLLMTCPPTLAPTDDTPSHTDPLAHSALTDDMPSHTDPLAHSHLLTTHPPTLTHSHTQHLRHTLLH